MLSLIFIFALRFLGPIYKSGVTILTAEAIILKMQTFVSWDYLEIQVSKFVQA